MSRSGVNIAFKLTALVLLLSILGIAIGILLVTLNVRDNVEATPVVTPYSSMGTVSSSTTSSRSSSTTTTAAVPLKPCTTEAPVGPIDPLDPKSTTEENVDPVHPIDPEDSKNIPEGYIISEDDPRYDTFAGLSNLFEKWMDLKKEPCDDFYHYVCGKGQRNYEQSPFDVSQNIDNAVEQAMWMRDEAYWNAAPLPVKQARWLRDRCMYDDTYTTEDQMDKMREMLQQLLSYTDIAVPWFTPNEEAATLDKQAFSRLLGYAKGQFGTYAFLTTFASVDFKNPDEEYTFYVDQPLPLFSSNGYANPAFMPQFSASIARAVNQAAAILGIAVDAITVQKMAEDVINLDKVIATTMQQDPIVRRHVVRNYNKFTLAEVSALADQFDWVAYIQSALTLLGDQITVDDSMTIIIEEPEILSKLSQFLATSNPSTVANYLYVRAFESILSAVPAPPAVPIPPPSESDAYRAVLNRDKRMPTSTILRKIPKLPTTRNNPADWCSQQVEALLPWPSTRLYVDADLPEPKDRATLKTNIAEIANWIFFGFRSQLDQLNWLDKDSKKAAFDKLDQVQLNVAYPDWGLDITAADNFMNMWLKTTSYNMLNEVLPFIHPTPRDRADFASFIGVTNAWYQPHLNSITFPEGILQEPFYSPNFPIASIFGGLGTISGHELTHGFDDQGVQWDGIGALNPWMTSASQQSFDAMAQCVIDEYNGFCPYHGVCVNGANTQGENIADNGGIQAAYKAFKAYESLNGADPRLPGFGSTFTSEQLFFLTFGQTWCDIDQTKAEYQLEIAVDAHSPPLYRVLGTLQNFPAFKNAFNCPADTPYTPTQHCEVWTSKPFQ